MISTGFVLVPALEERLFKLRLGVEWGHFTLGVQHQRSPTWIDLPASATAGTAAARGAGAWIRKRPGHNSNIGLPSFSFRKSMCSSPSRRRIHRFIKDAHAVNTTIPQVESETCSHSQIHVRSCPQITQIHTDGMGVKRNQMVLSQEPVAKK
jgi:hypothetical protein